jgi:hypothetical protein
MTVSVGRYDHFIQEEEAAPVLAAAADGAIMAALAAVHSGEPPARTVHDGCHHLQFAHRRGHPLAVLQADARHRVGDPSALTRFDALIPAPNEKPVTEKPVTQKNP